MTAPLMPFSGGEAIPAALKAMPRWAPWVTQWRPHARNGAGKWDKRPALGKSTAKPDTWLTFDAALAEYQRRPGKYAGLGFVTTGQHEVVGVDLDHCVDNGVVAPWAAEVVAQLDSYAEVSPSGTGLRIMALGQVARDWTNHETGIEVYGGHTARFLTLTGNRLPDAPTELRAPPSGDLDALELRFARGGPKADVVAAHMPELVDELLLPSTEELNIGISARDFLEMGTTGDDRSQTLFATSVALYAAGLADDEVFSILVRNEHAIALAMDKRGQDLDKAMDYLWRHHCGPGRAKAAASAATVDDFDALPDDPAARLAPSSAATVASLVATLRASLVTQGDDAGDFEDMPHCVEKWLPLDEVTLLAGHGGGGKSYVALSLAVHVALGLPFGRLATTPANVLFFSGEDGARVLKQRLSRICRAMDVDPARLAGRLHMLDVSDQDPALHREQRGPANGRAGATTETPLLHALGQMALEVNAVLVVVDNASDTFDGDEIRRTQVRQFVRSLRTRLARPGRAVLLLAHVNKNSAVNGRNAGSEDYSGSTAWHNSVRSRLSLTPAGADAMTIEHVKANLGEKASPMRLEWRGGVPHVVDDAVAAATIAAVQAENDKQDRQALLTVIQDFDARGERVSTAASGPCTTFNQLKTAAGFPTRITTASRLAVLMRELVDAGLVVRQTIKTEGRKSREVFTSTAAHGGESAPILNDGAANNTAERHA